jgi:NADPH-dependent curcumin reductase CurA
MREIASREVRFASRPKGLPTAENFSLVETHLRRLQDQEVLVRNRYLSVDPYVRGRMNDTKSYAPPLEIGAPIYGPAIGQVIASKAPEFKVGDFVASYHGWREAFIASPVELHPLNRDIQPLSAYLGVLGMTGMTAWVGIKLAALKAGETVFVSGAAGAVGHIAGQLAKLAGCHVIGAAGSAHKVDMLTKECGFDGAFNYKVGPTLEQLNALAPGGIDVYFDNVGGDMLETALTAMRVHGRIIACGSISGYNDDKPRPGPCNLMNIIGKRLTIRGLIVGDWIEHRPEFEAVVGGYYQTGKLVNKETIVMGIDHAVSAFLGLFHGENVGKMIIELPAP